MLSTSRWTAVSGQLVNTYGGPTDAEVTCQIRPPGIPGYRPYCPYTRDPAADGRWSTPNLTLAKRLAAASRRPAPPG